MRTFIAGCHPGVDGEHSNGSRKARKERLAKQPKKKSRCHKGKINTFDYIKYLKFLNNKRYHK